MNNVEDLPVRKNIRLKDYDYSQPGCYFITICVKDGREILWDQYDQTPVTSVMPVGAHSVRPPMVDIPLSRIGKCIKTAIENIPAIYENIEINNYVIMPNHIHILIVIHEDCGRTMCAPTISRIVKQCKEYVTKQIGYSIWQKSYHDRIIRNEKEYLIKWQYIDENPIKWNEDEYYNQNDQTIKRS